MKNRHLRFVKKVGKIGVVDEEHYVSRSPWDRTKGYVKRRPKHAEGWEKPASMIGQNERLKLVNQCIALVELNDEWSALLDKRFRDFCAENGYWHEPRGKKQRRRRRSMKDFLRSELMRGEAVWADVLEAARKEMADAGEGNDGDRRTE